MRVEFRECKLVGANFIATSLQNVLFENCFASYINLSSSKLKKVIIQECDFSNASLVETKIDNVEICETVLVLALIMHTNLEGLDLSTCDISGIKVNSESLKGVIVNENQAIALIRLLGVDVKRGEK